MPSACAACKTVGNLDADREHQLQAGRPARDELVERLAGHILHGDVAFVAAFAHFVDAAHIGMLDGRGQPRLAQHSGAHLLDGEQAGAQNLEHHGPLQQRVVGQVDHAAASGAQAAENFVMFNRFARHGSIKFTGGSSRTSKAQVNAEKILRVEWIA